MEKKYFVNNQIRAQRILLLSEEGEKVGEMSFHDAIKLAHEQDLDLMQVGENKDYATCKILKFDSWLYHEKKKQEKLDFKNRSHDIKTIQLRPSIGDNDFELKMKKVNEFLEDSHKVKIVIRFKTFRETQMKSINDEFIEKVIKTVENSGELDSKVTYGGKEINFMLKPAKKNIPKATKPGF